MFAQHAHVAYEVNTLCVSFAVVNLNILQMKNTLKLISLIIPLELSARDVVNPLKPYEEVFKEGQEGHDLYIVSHNDYYVGK